MTWNICSIACNFSYAHISNTFITCQLIAGIQMHKDGEHLDAQCDCTQLGFWLPTLHSVSQGVLSMHTGSQVPGVYLTRFRIFFFFPRTSFHFSGCVPRRVADLMETAVCWSKAFRKRVKKAFQFFLTLTLSNIRACDTLQILCFFF